jgi:hypothetical protein
MHLNKLKLTLKWAILFINGTDEQLQQVTLWWATLHSSYLGGAHLYLLSDYVVQAYAFSRKDTQWIFQK